MTTQGKAPDPARVFELFDRAADLGEDALRAFLAEACGDDVAMLREIEELLAFDPKRAATRPELAKTHPAQPARSGGRARDAMPTALGRFEVTGKLGEGGMGVVYEGRDPTLGRAVALKLVLRAGAAEGRTRLLREAQAMARVAHPNVVPVYEVGLRDDGVFVAMELVKGETLSSWLKREKRPWREALAKMVQAGRGLAAAHAAGVLHRDFKPDNVLLGEDGRARVVDFGLARAVAPEEAAAPEHAPRRMERTPGAVQATAPAASPSVPPVALDVTLTQEGTVMGTPSYMSPEHFEGSIGPWSDQWSFAVAAYRAVYGELPFRGDVADIRGKVLHSDAPRPPHHDDVPAEVEAAILRGMRRFPEERFAQVGAMVDALEAILVADPDSDRSISRRQRRRAALLIAALGATSFLSAGIRTDWTFDLGLRGAFVQGLLGLGFTITAALVFRRALGRTRHNRRIIAFLLLLLVSQSAHRVYGLHIGAAVADVLRVDAIFAIAFAAFAAIVLERWFAWQAVLAAAYLGASFVFPVVAVPGFGAFLVSSIALGVWFWREPPPVRDGGASSSQGSGRSSR